MIVTVSESPATNPASAKVTESYREEFNWFGDAVVRQRDVYVSGVLTSIGRRHSSDCLQATDLK